MYHSDDKDSIRNHWAANKGRLAMWVKGRLLNRADTHGTYVHLPHGWQPITCHKPVSDPILCDHFAGLQTIGLHAYDQSGGCRWGGIDIDNHGEDADVLNWEDVETITGELDRLKLPRLVEDSDGKGGFHVWVLFDQLYPLADVFGFLQYLIRNCHTRHETFPKQHTQTEYGNWLRLPGKHHKRDHWSKFWDGERWCAQGDAVSCLVGAEPADLDTVPTDIKSYRPKAQTAAGHGGRSGDDTTPGSDWLKNYRGNLRTLEMGELLGMSSFPDGGWVKVDCPWQDQHTTGKGGAAVIKSADGFPGFRCLHRHCDHRRVQDWLATFPEGVVDECCSERFGKDDWTPPTDQEQADVFAAKGATTEPPVEDAPVGDHILTGDDIDRLADSEVVRPVVGKVLEFGSVNMMSGRSFSGKSYLITNMMGAVCEGGHWLGVPCERNPVLYLNCDRNRLRRLRANIKRGMTDTGAFRDNLYMVETGALPETLTAAHLDQYARSIHTRRGDTAPLFIVIDTFRSAFLGEAEQGVENDAAAIKFIKPIREWTERTGHCVLIVHHNNKHADDYSGSGSFLMLLESKMNYQRVLTEPVGDLTINTRDDVHEVWKVGLDANRLPVRTTSTKQALAERILAAVEASEKGLTQQEITKAVGGKIEYLVEVRRLMIEGGVLRLDGFKNLATADARIRLANLSF